MSTLRIFTFSLRQGRTHRHSHSMRSFGTSRAKNTSIEYYLDDFRPSLLEGIARCMDFLGLLNIPVKMRDSVERRRQRLLVDR